MDPKNLNQLDPKIKEAYDRVIGTDLTSPQTSSPNAQIPTSEPSPQPPPEPSVSQFAPPSPPPPPSFGSSQTSPQSVPDVSRQKTPQVPVHLDTSQTPETPVSSLPVYQSFNSETGSQPVVPEATAIHHNSRLSVSTPILVVLGILFFAAYAVLWVMVLGIKLF